MLRRALRFTAAATLSRYVIAATHIYASYRYYVIVDITYATPLRLPGISHIITDMPATPRHALNFRQPRCRHATCC